MTRGIFGACADELSKIAVKLAPAEERGQLVRFGLMGAGAVPVISGLSNVIQHGRPWAVGTNLKRWLPAQMLTGALFGGALPAARHRIERSMQAKAKDRLQVQKMMREAGLENVKTSSAPGQDLRLPITGGTKMPTDDSKGFAKKLFQRSSAEVGPVASAKSLGGGNVTVRDIIPKFGAAMSDPLIQYLQKQAAAKALSDNEKDPQKDSAYAETKPQVELASETNEHGVFGDAVNSYHSAMKQLFTNQGAVAGKFHEKDSKGGVPKAISKEQRNAVAKQSHQP